MVDFVDILPLRETVEVRGHSITVKGVEMADVGQLVYEHPELAGLITGGKLDVAALLSLSDAIVSAIIAAGTPQLTPESAGNLALGEKADLLGPILRMTMPRGVGPFVDALTSALGTLRSSQPAPRPAPEPRAKKRAKAAA